MQNPTYRETARGVVALVTLLVMAGCGGGGALPTGVDSGTDQGGIDQPPLDNGTDGGDTGGDTGGGDTGGGDTGGGDNGGGTGGTPVTVIVQVAEGEDGGYMPATVTVPVGSTVVWQMVDDEHDVTFDGAAPAGGDIPETDEGGSASRTFTQPGTYTYHCEKDADDDDDAHSGTVIVTAGGGDNGGGDNGGGGEPQEPNTSASVRTVGDSFSPRTVTIAEGGTVSWTISGDTHNVTFTGAAPTGGNIPNTSGGTVSRSFPAAGRYDYFCTRHSGMSGAVVVQ